MERTAGVTGVCGETDQCRVGSACVHFGEEPSFTGTRGSGTIFFSGCSSRCFFCQNHQISLERLGEPVSPDELAEIALGLLADGAHNLNFVTPDHFLPHVVLLCERLRDQGVEAPFIYNCSGYERVDMIDALCEAVDIFLPDFKYSEPSLAQACMGDSRYPELARRAIVRMVDGKGMLQPWDPTGAQVARSGVLVRHLVLPGEVENSIGVLNMLADACGVDLPLSVMSQFRPTAQCHERGLLSEPLSMSEYDRVCGVVEDLGFERVYIQPESGDSDFLPDFSEGDAFTGNRKHREAG